jgi:hypothetical protein
LQELLPESKIVFFALLKSTLSTLVIRFVLKGYCVWVQEMPNTLPSTEASLCLGCFACTQANENENEAYPLTSLLQLEGQSY